MRDGAGELGVVDTVWEARVGKLVPVRWETSGRGIRDAGHFARASVLIGSDRAQILVLTRFLPQISLRNLRKLDCYANRYPLRSKTLLVRSTVSEAVGRQNSAMGAYGLPRPSSNVRAVEVKPRGPFSL